MNFYIKSLYRYRPAVVKILLVMRIIVFLLTTAILQVSASTYGQNVTIRHNNADLAKVIRELRKQTGFDFVYSDKMMESAKPVSINLNNVPFEQALEQCFKNQPLTFSIADKIVTVKEKQEPAFLENIIARFQTIDVRGRVVDSLGNGLPGASIKVKNGKGATTSNANGEFYLQNVDENAVLVITYIGYDAREISARANLSNVILKISDSKLDEVQVIAYGTVQKKFSTSSIGTVSAKEIGDQPVTNPLLALQGRVPGLFVNQLSGMSASGVDINIQGLNSLRPEANGPLYVIDGVPFMGNFPSASSSLMGGAVVAGVTGASTFNFINPADIESVSILKDADATAVYGSRAANGAILITTKKGKTGKTQIDVNARNGYGRIDQRLKMMNTQQYLAMRKEAYTNGGKKVPTTPAEFDYSNADLAVWDQNRYTDWQKELVGNTAHFTDIQASVSGGSENTQFLIGYNYNRQSTVYDDGKADLKGNIHFNLNHASKDNKFKIFLTGTYLQDKNELNNVDLMGSAINLAPNAIALRNPDGSINFGPLPGKPNTSSLFNNPLTIMLQKFTGNTTNIMGNNTLSYEILPGLQLKSSMGYNKLFSDEISIIPGTIYSPEFTVKNRSAKYLNKSTETWIIEPQITYVKESNIGRFDALFGGTFQQTKNSGLQQSGKGFANDEQLENLLAATSVTVDNVYKSLYKYNAFFGRVNYRLQDKYILNLTARRDGSSRFGKNRKFHNFYAIGTAWLFGDESAVRSALPWLSSGKLRANYGTTGSDAIADYGYLSTLSSYTVDNPYAGIIGLSPVSLSNPYLQWEETKKLNLGLDLGFLKNRISLSLNWYRNRSSNQLIGTALPITTGFGFIQQNFPATVQNKGLEALLDAHIVKSKNFNWHTSVNYTKNKNKLIEYQDLEKTTDVNLYVIGQPINIQHVFKYAGVNSSTGLYEFYSAKGDRTSTPDLTTDRTVLVDPNPKWYGGFFNTLQYKGFELSVLFQYVKQNAPNYRFGNPSSAPGNNAFNQPVGITDRWQKAEDIKDIQKASTNYAEIGTPWTSAMSSNAAYSDASYLRLKNLSFSYTLPTQILKSVKLSNVRAYLQGQNVFTISNFIGTDPETKVLSGLPPLRVITVGLQIGI
jgi:TonB-linked SusC/RagA family outer membrane protein